MRPVATPTRGAAMTSRTIDTGTDHLRAEVGRRRRRASTMNRPERRNAHVGRDAGRPRSRARASARRRRRRSVAWCSPAPAPGSARAATSRASRPGARPSIRVYVLMHRVRGQQRPAHRPRRAGALRTAQADRGDPARRRRQVPACRSRWPATCAYAADTARADHRIRQGRAAPVTSAAPHGPSPGWSAPSKARELSTSLSPRHRRGRRALRLGR